jgi:AAA+ ATPase superfamily predicted ATPase
MLLLHNKAMRLPFLNRTDESRRLQAFFGAREGGLAVVYGRRRLGKSRLLSEALPGMRAVYYVADDREATLQRAALAGEIGRLIPGFSDVTYPGWDELLRRFWGEAPRRAVLAIDEFPSLVASAPELPSLVQKRVDSAGDRGVRIVVTGSSQRMMQGLVLDGSAPLFGRAREILRVKPLRAGWIRQGLSLRSAVAATEAFAVWGGVPRYWELAAEQRGLSRAMAHLVFSPLGVLHDEPRRLLLDDLSDTTQASSILALIGAGSHRLSEIAGRLEKPATSLARPLARLLDLGLVRRDVPFGSSVRDSKRTAYRLDDPFLRFWFRFVEPNRSRLGAGQVAEVVREVGRKLHTHVATVFEDVVRQSVPRARWGNQTWRPAASWWGPGLDRLPMEIDVVAESEDGSALLLGEVKWSRRIDWKREEATLRRKAENLPLARGRHLRFAVWAPSAPPSRGELLRFGARRVLDALR